MRRPRKDSAVTSRKSHTVTASQASLDSAPAMASRTAGVRWQTGAGTRAPN